MEGLVMRVDGSTPADALQAKRPELKQLHLVPRPGDTQHVREARLSTGATVQSTTQVLRELRDSYQHVSATSAEAAYTPSGETADEPHGVRGAFEAVREAVSEPPPAEIADLKTTTRARGLPLISEPYQDGPAYNTVFEAYKETGASEAEESRAPRGHELFDTLG